MINRVNKLKSNLVILLSVFLSFGVTSGAISKPLTPVSIQLKWKHQFQFAGYYAAQEMGYYKDEGLAVDIREWQDNTNVIEQVIQNRADFGIGDATILSEFVNGQPIVAIAAIFQEDPMVLFTKKSSGIVKPKNLIGQGNRIKI